MSSLTRKRLVAVFALLLCGFSLVNHYFELGIFGSHSKQALVLSFVAGLLLVHFFGPTIDDMEKHRRSSNRS
jgi:hypothetical protein